MRRVLALRDEENIRLENSEYFLYCNFSERTKNRNMRFLLYVYWALGATPSWLPWACSIMFNLGAIKKSHVCKNVSFYGFLHLVISWTKNSFMDVLDSNRFFSDIFEHQNLEHWDYFDQYRYCTQNVEKWEVNLALKAEVVRLFCGLTFWIKIGTCKNGVAWNFRIFTSRRKWAMPVCTVCRDQLHPPPPPLST